METYEVQVTQQAGSIGCDFERAEKYLDDRLAEYQNVIFTEESKKDAKNAVATLRKEKKAFADRIKEVKEEYMKPFMLFAERANGLLEKYDQPINFINGQVSAFEEKRIEEKRAQIVQLYTECIADMEDVLPLKRLYNPKWENATFNPTQIRKELMERKEAAKQALTTIREMNTDMEDKAIQMYLETYNLTDVVLKINQHEQQKREILAREQERIRREEEERIRREEREKLEAERKSREALERAEAEKQAALARAEAEKQAAVEQARERAAQDVIEGLLPDLDGESNLYEYRMALTADAKEKLEMYLDSVGIDWELI